MLCTHAVARAEARYFLHEAGNRRGVYRDTYVAMWPADGTVVVPINIYEDVRACTPTVGLGSMRSEIFDEV